MAVPSYTTDLTTIAIGSISVDTGTWDESSDAGWDTAGTMVDDANLYYNGTACVSAQYTKDGTGSGTTGPGTIMYVHGSTFTIPADGAALIHHLWAAPPALLPVATGGIKVLIGNGLGDFDAYDISGSDFAPAPKGGWTNYAINPAAATADDIVGTGAASPFTTVGVAVAATAQARGNPNACNAVRHGRCEAIFTDGQAADYATFTGFSDTDAISTNKWSLLDPIEGGIKWQGLMSLGTAATAVDFRDSNVNISVANTTKVTAGFSKIEVNNTASNIEWTAVNITALGTTSKGSFEMIDGATLAKDSCTFTDMNTFIYNKGVGVCNIIDSTYRRCNLITMGGASFDGCTIDASNDAAKAIIAATPAEAALFTNGELVSAGSGNGIEVGGVAADFTFTGVDFTGYSTTVDADKAIYVNIAAGTVNITVDGGSGVTLSSHVRTAGATVNIIAGAVTVKATAITDTGTLIQNARIMLRAKDATGSFPFEESVTITRATTVATVTHTAHGLATNDYVVISGATQQDYNVVEQITVTDINTYTYTVANSPTTPATGTIISTFVALYGLTDALGVVSTSRVYASAQPVTGYGRKSSADPFYKQGSLGGSVDTTSGYDKSAVLVLDQ